MAAYKSNVHRNVKGIRIREIKISNKPFGMDVFRAEEKILSFFHNMRHIVIGAVSSVADEDIPGSGPGIVPVNHITESPEFILLVDGLDEGVRISMFLQVIKSIQVHAVEAFCGMSFRYKVFWGRKGGPAEEGEGGSICGKETEAGVCTVQNSRVETMENGFQGFRSEFGALLVKGGGRWGVCLQAKEIKQFYPGAGRTAGNQEGDEFIRPHFSGTGKIPSRS